MPTNVDDVIKKLSPAQRKKVETRAAQLIAEEMTQTNGRGRDAGRPAPPRPIVNDGFMAGPAAATPGFPLPGPL